MGTCLFNLHKNPCEADTVIFCIFTNEEFQEASWGESTPGDGLLVQKEEQRHLQALHTHKCCFASTTNVSFRDYPRAAGSELPGFPLHCFPLT